MGKPTGFLEFPRRDCPAEAAEARVRHWKEFHPLLPEEELRRQGGRCMDCGVPFCQSGVKLNGMFTGCPLHNLIPEWNDLIFTGNFDLAYRRLRKTNNFPEFTGRVCPALCEAACTCSLHGDAVTTRANELGLSEYAWANGLTAPRTPGVRTGKKVAVVGSGPAGLAAADQLNLRGHSVTVFERADRPGGLLMYGIPNMKLEKGVVERRAALMIEEGVEFRLHCDVGRDIDPRQLLDEYDAVVLCCGAKTPRDLSVPGREAKGVYFAVDYLTAATRALLEGAPAEVTAKGKRVLVVGGGDTGNDCLGTAIRQGCRGLVQLEMLPKPPDARTAGNPWPEWPKVCKTDYGQEEAIALFGGDPRRYQTTVKELKTDKKGSLRSAVTVKLEFREENGRRVMGEVPGSEEELPCELLLIAAGFVGCEGYVPDAFGLKTTPGGTVAAASPEGHSAGVEKLFVAGDMRRGQSLVVWAIAEGRAAAREVDEYLMGYTNLT